MVEPPSDISKETTVVKDLLSLAQGYLAAEGWEVKASGRDLLRADRAGRGDHEKEYLYVWVPEHEGGDFSREGWYMGRFEEARQEHPTAEKVFLISTLEGLSATFRAGARQWHAVKILAPAQFFDTASRWERDERTASASKELRDRGLDVAKDRIPQPFQVIQSPRATSNRRSSDLFDTIREELRSHVGQNGHPSIHIVVGPAGMGKSVLFDSLYADLHEEFLDNKRARFLSPRPFALLPEYLDDKSVPTITSLLHNYLRTEFTRSMDQDMFNWRLINGLGILLLDGLDEVLERDARFFDYLADLITMPHGTTLPSIVICVRDSLFATLSALKDFCDDFSDYVCVYRLSDWQQESKIAFAKKRLKSERSAKNFARDLAERPGLDNLGSTPYYCGLLVDEFAEGGLPPADAEIEVLELALERILQRERDKGLLLGVPDDGIRDFIESCATTNLFEGGVPSEDVQEMADVVILEWIEEEEEEEERRRLATQLGQVAVFSHGYDGRLRFAQEPLEHYLAARHLARSLLSTPEYLARHEFPDNVVRLTSLCVAPEAFEKTWDLLVERMREDSIAGRNALKLVLRMSSHTDKLAKVQLPGVNLSEVQFDGHMLSNANFDGADLTNTDFCGADLTGSSLSGCLIRGTRFDANTPMLSTIDFGEMRRFYSICLGDDVIDDPRQLSELIGELRADLPEMQTTCATARQLRHLFGKFVDETGRGRRKYLPERALLRGKQIVPHVDEILRGAIRAGYLVEVPSRDRISRAEDDSYSEIVKFRSELQMSPGIHALLDDTCTEADCPHVR